MPTPATTAGATDGATPLATGETPDTTAELDPSAQELVDLAAQFGASPTRIRYDFSTTSPDGDYAGTMVSYWLPPDRWRLDYEIAGQSSTLIGSDGLVYFCSAPGGTGLCYVMESDQSPLPFASGIANPGEMSDLIRSQLGGVEFERSERQIAGQSATCFTTPATTGEQDGPTEYCLNADGAALTVRSTMQKITVQLEATAVDAAVSDADFAIPYEVVDLPTGLTE